MLLKSAVRNESTFLGETTLKCGRNKCELGRNDFESRLNDFELGRNDLRRNGLGKKQPFSKCT